MGEKVYLRGETGAYPAARQALRSPRIQLHEALRDRLRHQLVDAPAERRDLLHAARGDEAVLRARHHVHGLDLGRELAVQVVHLELPLEVRDHAQPLHHRLRVVLAREVDDELGEHVDEDVLAAGQRHLEELHALVYGEQRLLVQRIAHDPHDDAVEDARGAADDVDVTVRHRVVRAWADRRDHLEKTVMRAEP